MATPNTVIPVFTLGNDKPFLAQLFKVVDAKVVPLDTGTPEAFLATSPSANVPVAPELTCTIAHVKKEIWEVIFESSAAKDALLVTHFAAADPYLVVIHPDGVRVVALCAFDPILYAKVKK